MTKKTCGKFYVSIIFKLGKTRSSLVPRITMNSSVVYLIPCSCGAVYIRETRRNLETQIKDHKDACRMGGLGKSTIAVHAWNHQHQIVWEETSVINKSRNCL